MLTVEEHNKVVAAAVNGQTPAERGLPDTPEVQAAYDEAVEWAANLPDGAQVDMVSEWPDADLDADALYSQSADDLAAKIFGGGDDTGGAPAPEGGDDPVGDAVLGEAKGIVPCKDCPPINYTPVTSSNSATVTVTTFTPQGKAAGGVDKNRGGAEKLRRYWVRGAGAAKIQWGVPGDFDRCVALLTEHMGARAKGYCNLRHQDAVGAPPGQGHGKSHPFLTGQGLMQYKRADTGQSLNPVADGVMVALYAPDDVAFDHALDGGTPPQDMHVTLAYLGKVDDVPDPGPLLDVVADYAAGHPPLDAQISGVGRFVGGDDGDVQYLSVDSPALPEFRAGLVAALEGAGASVSRAHGFTPHMTLAYLDPTESSPVESVDPASTSFGLLSMAYGPDVWDFPMGAAE